jgi:hypothetical protein
MQIPGGNRRLEGGFRRDQPCAERLTTEKWNYEIRSRKMSSLFFDAYLVSTRHKKSHLADFLSENAVAGFLRKRYAVGQ